MKSIWYYLRHPLVTLIKLDENRIITLNDKLYLKLKFKQRMKYSLNLNNPKTFNEKMQWLKVNDRKDIYTTLADKYEVKKYVSKLIGNEYVIPLLGVYDKFDDIDFEKLPNQFVIKCTHNSGGVLVVKDKKDIDFEEAKKLFDKNLKKNYYYSSREWPYKNIKPRIIVEEYIKDDIIDDLRDYKFWCFNGEPKYVYITVKNEDIFENFYDMKFEPVTSINHGFPRSKIEFEKPANFEEMKDIAKTLARNIPFSRIDLHNVNGKILFGEITFYDWGGMRPFTDYKMDLELGKLIDIGKKIGEGNNNL